MLEAPANFVAAQRAVAELLLGDADRFDVEDAVNDTEVVINATDALLVVEVAFAGAIRPSSRPAAGPDIATRRLAS